MSTRVAAIAAALAAWQVAAVGAQAVKVGVLREKLAADLQRIAGALDGVMGYAVVDLTTGDRLGALEHELFPAASSIKLTILYELFREADEGRIRLDEPRQLDRRHAVGGTGVLIELGTPILTWRDYATLMIVLSDNTATNVLLDTLGMEAVTRRMTALGLKETRVRRRMIDLEAARRGDENVSTPAELARLLEVVHQGLDLKPATRAELLAILKKRKSSALVRGVPSGIEVASKPGELEGVRADAGIVYAKSRPYIFVAMTTYLRDEQEGEKAIEEASRVTYQYFDRLGSGSEYGRKIR